MPQEILINAGAAETRVAVVEDGKLQALTCERTFGDGASEGGLRVGDIVLGRVLRVLPAVQAAFVDIGRDHAGFLGAREARCLASTSPDREPTISELVREGDEVVVQIIKDEIGEKGARLTAAVTVPGRLCVLTPFQPGVSVSRRITDEAERARLTALGEALSTEASGELIAGAGYILRTAALGAGAGELREDAIGLARDRRAILAARNNAKPPALLHRDLDPVERALRDLARADTARILIDDAAAAEAARAYCRRVMPEIEERVEYFPGSMALFDLYDLEADIDGLVQPRVPLECGGWIVIESTEALTAVDVNSGSFTHGCGLEATALTVNMEAAHELGRQLRLRGIGGLIVVDFIHTQEADHMGRVLEALTQSLARDGTPALVSPMSQFGLVEITRKRVREPLAFLSSESCAACSGQGLVSRTNPWRWRSLGGSRPVPARRPAKLSAFMLRPKSCSGLRSGANTCAPCSPARVRPG